MFKNIIIVYLFNVLPKILPCSIDSFKFRFMYKEGGVLGHMQFYSLEGQNIPVKIGKYFEAGWRSNNQKSQQ